MLISPSFIAAWPASIVSHAPTCHQTNHPARKKRVSWPWPTLGSHLTGMTGSGKQASARLSSVAIASGDVPRGNNVARAPAQADNPCFPDPKPTCLPKVVAHTPVGDPGDTVHGSTVSIQVPHHCLDGDAGARCCRASHAMQASPAPCACRATLPMAMRAELSVSCAAVACCIANR
jgi:hypothetical protein